MWSGGPRKWQLFFASSRFVVHACALPSIFRPIYAFCVQFSLRSRETTQKRLEKQIAHAIETKQYLDEVSSPAYSPYSSRPHVPFLSADDIMLFTGPINVLLRITHIGGLTMEVLGAEAERDKR